MIIGNNNLTHKDNNMTADSNNDMTTNININNNMTADTNNTTTDGQHSGREKKQ